MLIRLTRKLARHLDGIDLLDCAEGDVLDLPRDQAQLLIAERWALPFQGPAPLAPESLAAPARLIAADPPTRAQAITQLHRAGAEIDGAHFDGRLSRRVEDRVREELRDARARLVVPERPAAPLEDEKVDGQRVDAQTVDRQSADADK